MKMNHKKQLVLKNLSRFQCPKVGAMLVASFLVAIAFLALSKPYKETSLQLRMFPNIFKSLIVISDDVNNGFSDELVKKFVANSNSDEFLGSPIPYNYVAFFWSTHEFSSPIRNFAVSPKLPSLVISTNLKTEKKMNPQQVPMEVQTTNLEVRPLCDILQTRSEVCDMDGNIRTHGNSSTVAFVASPKPDLGRGNESYRIRPYARKGDDYVMGLIREVRVKSVDDFARCTVNHTVPAIIFSTGGYIGNMFHDFTDVLMPLFATAREFDGEVQFLVTNMSPWWIRKYRIVLEKLSKYEVVDFDTDPNVRCFDRVIVGLRSHKELTVVPSKVPNGYSATDFTEFIRATYNLTRQVVRAGPSTKRPPRLMIISRARSRAFTNVNEIVRLARDVGYETTVREAKLSSNVTEFADAVNACDVLMGVHGAGITNMVYLPSNATVVQVVPWGGLGGYSRYAFGEPAKDMGLNYVEYEIKEEESSLIEVYPRDHPVFKDPFKYHKNGWHQMRVMFMDNQNVKIDVNRFRPVLLQALEFFKKQ